MYNQFHNSLFKICIVFFNMYNKIISITNILILIFYFLSHYNDFILFLLYYYHLIKLFKKFFSIFICMKQIQDTYDISFTKIKRILQNIYIIILDNFVFSLIFQFVDSNIPLCFVGDDREAPGASCVMKENVDSVLQLLKRLQPILTKKAVSMICDNSSETPYLTDSEIMQMFTNNKVVC